MDDGAATEYRHLPADDEDFHRYVRYAFRPTAGPWDDEARETLQERIEAGLAPRENRGLFVPDREDPVTVAGWHDFRMRVRGAAHRVGGVSAVATPPEHRRQGYVREMLAAMLEEFREEGVAFSALWPFKRSFYRELGWDTCSAYTELSGPPAQFRSAGAPRAGSFHPVDGGDWETLAPVLAAHDEGRDLHVERSAEWWEHRVFSWWDAPDSFGSRWVDDEGETRGYVVYRFEEGDGEDGRTLRAVDLAWADPTAFRHLLRFLGDHDSQAETVEAYVPAAPTPPVLDLVDDPSALTVETKAGPMFRLVDVPRALTALSYPPVTERVVFEVTDPLVGTNEGRFELDVEDGRATCRPTEDAADLSVGIGHLSQLAVGYRDLGALVDAGAVEASPSLVERCDTLFPSVPTFLREGF